PPHPLPEAVRGSKTGPPGSDAPSRPRSSASYSPSRGFGRRLGEGLFALAGDPRSFATLPAALAAAADRAPVIVPAGLRLPTRPLSVRGKALVLRAAPGERPSLEAVDDPGLPWAALLASDRPLTLEEIDLRRGPGHTPPLVEVEGGAL